MHIAVIGTGYVGLVTGACFAEFGVDVTCVDVDADKIARLEAGVMPIYEPGLEQLVTKNVQRVACDSQPTRKQAVEQALVIFLAVGTPPQADGSPDLSFVDSAARSVAEHMNGYKVIVTKSTVPIGTGERIRSLVKNHQKRDLSFWCSFQSRVPARGRGHQRFHATRSCGDWKCGRRSDCDHARPLSAALPD